MACARSVLALGLVYLIGSGLASAQNLPQGNPREGNPEAIQKGKIAFRSRCANCHGIDARGNRGPDLAALLASGAPDQRVFQTIRRGVPGTEMPPSPTTGGGMTDDEIWMTMAYLRTLSAPALEPSTGDAARGEKIFQDKCSSCHRVNNRGGRLGPNLSRIGSARTRAALTREVRRPSDYIVPGYEPVTLVTREGERISGVVKNEDTFSIQIMDTRERLRGHLKASLREVIRLQRSLMPDFPPAQLSDRELDDLLAYVGSLRGRDSSGR